jgi:hypothetical protein
MADTKALEVLQVTRPAEVGAGRPIDNRPAIVNRVVSNSEGHALHYRKLI